LVLALVLTLEFVLNIGRAVAVVGGEVREVREEVRWRSRAVVRFWKGSG